MKTESTPQIIFSSDMLYSLSASSCHADQWFSVFSVKRLPVCHVWMCVIAVWGPADSSVWAIKHTHTVISTAQSQCRLEPLEGCWTKSQLQLACSVTVYTITPFKICQLHRWACQKPSDCCLVVSAFANNISAPAYLQSVECVCGTEEELLNDILMLYA